MKRQYSLKQCQQLFLQTLIEKPATATTEHLNFDSEGDDLSQLLRHEIKDPAERISIYQDNYQLALVNCLKSTFIHTCRLLGENTFNKLALDYIEANPSKSESLNYYGENFSGFISNELTKSTHNNSKKNNQSAIYCIAQSDYLKQCCYYAENNQVLDINEFVNLPLEVQMNTYFVRQPSLFLMRCYFELANVSIISSIENISINEQYTCYLYFRNEGKVQVKKLDKSIYDLLTFFEQPANMNALNEHQLENLPILLKEGWLTLAGARI